MELDQLRYFLRVAERQNFTRASEDLGISQSALSRAVIRLEEELGQPVFERQGRRVSLTDAGELLRARAHQIITLLEDTKSEITDDGRTGRVRVGAIPTIAPFFLPAVLQEFAARFPEAMVTVQEKTTDELIKGCQQGDVDLVILALPIAAQHLETEVLFDEELLLVLPPEHQLTQASDLCPDDVEGQPFVLLSEAHCLTDNILTFCRRRSIQPVAVERTSQLAMVQELVSLGHGISLVPAMARRKDDSNRRVYRSFTTSPPFRTIAVAWNPYRFQSRLLQAFREQLRGMEPVGDS